MSKGACWKVFLPVRCPVRGAEGRTLPFRGSVLQQHDPGPWPPPPAPLHLGHRAPGSSWPELLEGVCWPLTSAWAWFSAKAVSTQLPPVSGRTGLPCHHNHSEGLAPAATPPPVALPTPPHLAPSWGQGDTVGPAGCDLPAATGTSHHRHSFEQHGFSRPPRVSSETQSQPHRLVGVSAGAPGGHPAAWTPFQPGGPLSDLCSSLMVLLRLRPSCLLRGFLW